jgi:uncharacterized protein YjbI with pentapeptide repeats
MANSHIHVHHRPFRILHNLDNKRVPPKRQEEQRDQAWTKFPLPLIVEKLRSSDHDVVLRAVEELRMRGCLSDNTLPWICLQYANLQAANLSAANLKNADFQRANLEMADLSYANLDGARLMKASLQSVNLEKASLDGANLVGANLREAKNVSDKQLSQASRMRVAILTDGSLYDGRFNLPGDFADASILHVDLNDPAAIAAFYGVSLEDFLRGQEWRRANMPAISSWHESFCFQNAEVIINW